MPAALGVGLFAGLDRKTAGARPAPVARFLARRAPDAAAPADAPVAKHRRRSQAESPSSSPEARVAQADQQQNGRQADDDIRRRHDSRKKDSGKSKGAADMVWDVDLQLPSNCKLLGYLGRIRSELQAVVANPEPLVPVEHLLNEPRGERNMETDKDDTEKPAAKAHVSKTVTAKDLRTKIRRGASGESMKDCTMSPQNSRCILHSAPVRKDKSFEQRRSRRRAESLSPEADGGLMPLDRGKFDRMRSCSLERACASPRRQRLMLEDLDMPLEWEKFDRRRNGSLERACASPRGQPMMLEDLDAQDFSFARSGGRWDFSSKLGIF